MARTHDAFLSYSHQADSELATAIENGLERLAKPLLKLRAMDVFRDQTSMTASPALWPSILEHLSGSRWFILLACPGSAQSPWCAKEVTWWLENRGLDTLLMVVTGGELQWNAAASDFDWTVTTALPTALAGKVQEEPLYVDLRWTLASQKKAPQDPRFREQIVSLAAPIRGMTRDDLDSADRRQLLKNKALVRGLQAGLGVVAVLALWAAAYATVQKRQAISDAVVAKAQAHASQALLNLRSTPLVALGSAIAATDLAAAYPEPSALESAVLWAMRADIPALRPPLEAEAGLRQSLVVSRLRAVFQVAATTGVKQVDGAPWDSIVVVRMSDHSVIVLDAANEYVVARRGPGNERLAAAYLMASGRHVMIIGEGGSVAVWEFASGNEHIAGSLPSGKEQEFAMTPQRDFVIRKGTAGTWLIDSTDGRIAQAKACPGMTYLRGAVSVGGTVLSIQQQPGRNGLGTCDLLSGRAKGVIKATTAGLMDVQVSPDGRFLATASNEDETVRIWDLKSGSERAVLKGHTAVPMKLAFSADSQRIAVGIADGNVSSWRIRQGTSRSDQQDEIFLATGADGSIHHIQELMGGKRILTAHSTVSGQQYLRLWSGPMDVDVTLIGDQGDVHSALIATDARRIWLVTAKGLAGAGFDGKRQTAFERRSARPIRRGGFTRDGSYAFAVDDQGNLETWSIANASISHYWETGKPVVVDAQPIGECCVLALLREKGELTVYDLARPDKAAETRQLGGDFGAVRFGRRDDRFFLKRFNSFEIHVGEQSTRRVELGAGAPAPGSAFTAEDRSVLAVSEYDTRLLDASEARNDHVLSGHAAGIRYGQVSPDGTRVATASSDWTARVWDAASGAQIVVLRGHLAEVTQVEFGRDGRFVATAGRDGTIRAWNTIGGDQLLRIEVATDAKVRILGFASEYLLASVDNKVGLYRCTACQQTAELLRDARARMKAGIPKEFAVRSAGTVASEPRSGLASDGDWRS